MQIERTYHSCNSYSSKIHLAAMASLDLRAAFDLVNVKKKSDSMMFNFLNKLLITSMKFK